MLNFLARFFPNLSDVIKALGELTYKDVSFQWTDSHDKAFVESKKLIAQGPVLCHFYSQLPTTLQVDVSSVGVGGRLLQNDQSVLSFLKCTGYMKKFFLLIFVLPKSGIVHDYVRSCLSKSLRIIMNPIVSVHTFNEL